MKVIEEENYETVIGHHVKVQLYEPTGPIYERIDELYEEKDIEKRDRRRIRIEVGDVNWDETKSITMKIETFDKIMTWFDMIR